jgi:molybdopterin synthase sulfur carrier subunit
MLESNAMVSVSLHYWAGARAAAGVAEEAFEAQSVADALRLACQRRSDPRFDRVIKMSSVLIDGRTAHREDLEQQLTEAVQVEVLPPFAGGR